MKPITGSQIPAYDSLSKTIGEAADLLDKANVARLNPDARDKLHTLLVIMRALASELLSEAHRARRGDQP